MPILLTVAYDGTNYCGWQVQKDFATVQSTLEQALSRLFGTAVTVLGASRTDAGVHALGQRALLSLPEGACKIPLARLPQVINAVLPADITIVHAGVVPEGFHPIFDARRKTYVYAVWNGAYPNPTLRNLRYHVRFPLDAARMHEAARQFIGTHDFEAFRAVGGTTKTSVRTMFDAGVARDGDNVFFTVTGSGFLYNMVRIMAGTLIEAGKGNLAPEDICGIIQSCDRTCAGKTVPPQGLTLVRVTYEEE